METDGALLQIAALIQSTRVNTHTHTHTHNITWAQYWDLATAARSLSMGWDWDTRGETAWMTAVNLG